MVTTVDERFKQRCADRTTDQFSANANQTLTTPRRESLLANDADPDSSVLATVLATVPPRGVLTLNLNGTFTYAPNPGFMGEDHFSISGVRLPDKLRSDRCDDHGKQSRRL